MAMNSHRHVDDWLTHLCWKTGTALNVIILGAWYMYVLIVHRSMLHYTVRLLRKHGCIGQCTATGWLQYPQQQGEDSGQCIYFLPDSCIWWLIVHSSMFHNTVHPLSKQKGSGLMEVLLKVVKERLPVTLEPRLVLDCHVPPLIRCTRSKVARKETSAIVISNEGTMLKVDSSTNFLEEWGNINSLAVKDLGLLSLCDQWTSSIAGPWEGTCYSLHKVPKHVSQGVLHLRKRMQGSHNLLL